MHSESLFKIAGLPPSQLQCIVIYWAWWERSQLHTFTSYAFALFCSLAPFLCTYAKKVTDYVKLSTFHSIFTRSTQFSHYLLKSRMLCSWSCNSFANMITKSSYKIASLSICRKKERLSWMALSFPTKKKTIAGSVIGCLPTKDGAQ